MSLVFTSEPTRFWRIHHHLTGLGPISKSIRWYPFQYHWSPEAFFTSFSRDTEKIYAMFDEGWMCGWRDLNLMKNFPGTYECILQLEKFGFKVYELEAIDCLILPDGQIMFHPTKLVSELAGHSPKDFFAGFDADKARAVFDDLEKRLRHQ